MRDLIQLFPTFAWMKTMSEKMRIEYLVGLV